MVVTAVVPPGKTGSLIYTVFPLALGLWFSTFLQINDENLPLVLGALSIFVSVASLGLYEIGFDERLVKGLARHRLDRKTLKQSFLGFNVLLRTWQSAWAPLPEFSKSQHDLPGEVERYIQATVSGYSVMRRLWRIRATFYLMISIFFLLWTGLVSGARIQSFIPEGILLRFPATSQDQLACTLIWTPVLVFLLFSICWYRHRHLSSFIFYLIQFRYLQTLVALPSVDWKKTEKYTEYEGLRGEIKLLESFVIRDDWPTFLVRWVPLRNNLLLRVWIEFPQVMFESIYLYWTGLVKASKKESDEMTMKESSRKFGWLLYYASEVCKKTSSFTVPDESARKMVVRLFKKYKEDTGDWKPRSRKDRLMRRDTRDLKEKPLIALSNHRETWTDLTSVFQLKHDDLGHWLALANLLDAQDRSNESKKAFREWQRIKRDQET